jgi:hypothetical protein
MKYILIIMFFSFFCMTSQAQSDIYKIKAMSYLTSSKEIKKTIRSTLGKKALTLKLSEKEIELDTVFFHNSRACLSATNHYSSNLKIDTNAMYSLFFSAKIGKYLFASLLPNTKFQSIEGSQEIQKISTDNYHELRQFNTSIQFLFLFDENNDIECVRINEVIFN